MSNYLSLAVSSVALLVSIFAFIQSGDHNEKTLRPTLEFRYKFGIGSDEGDGGYLNLVNVGPGLAKITNIKATFDGNELDTDAASLKKIANIPGFSAFGLSVGGYIGPGDSVYLYKIDPENIAQICKRDKERKLFFQNMKILVEYSSLHDYVDTTEFDYKSTNEFNC